MRKANRILLKFLLLSILPGQSLAAMEDNVIEQADRANEIKQSVREKKGTWLPVPIPVSNPTIGSGLQAVLLYLHPQEDPDIPTATSGVGAMYTDSESWLVGAFHDGNFKSDLYRYRVLGGTGEFNLDYYGSSVSSASSTAVPYNIASDIILGQFQQRIPGTEDLYLGLRYMFTDSTVVFDLSGTIPGLPPVSDSMTTSGLGLIFNFDTRDNNYYPTTGSYAEVLWMRDKPSIGSDFDFDKLTSFYNYYLNLSRKDTLALRGTLENADGDAPFYLLPALKLRGFPVGRYRDKSSFSAHTEWRRKFHPRWGFILFYEFGSVAANVSELLQEDMITAVGGGIRWQVTEDKKMNLGIDVGYSEDDSAVYLQVGEKF